MAAKQDVIIRGTKEGLYLILNDEQKYEDLLEKLKLHLKKSEGFFQGAEVILDAGRLQLSIEQILEIQDTLAYPYGLKLKRIVRADSANKDQATVRRENPARNETSGNQLKREYEVRKESEPTVWPETLLYKGTLRSGQRISYDGNVVIVGEVNPGAEVEASGDIVVMGVLRGVASAGATGNENAVVVAFRLEPTQLRIGRVIGRPPEGERARASEPEVARLKNGVIVVEPLEGCRWEG